MRVAELYYQRFFLFATATLVCFALLGKHLGDSTALIVLVVGVVVLGLPHGALDPLVATKAFAAADRRFSLTVFYVGYAGIAMAYGSLWIKFPMVGLVSFLVIAAFHFGSDWQARGSAVTRLAYGITLVTMPAIAHPAELASIYATLGVSEAATIVAASRICAVVALGVASSAAILRDSKYKSDLWELLAIAVGAVVLKPLIFFTCYFTLLHSPRHLFETAGLLGIESLRSVFLKTLPIVGATLLMGVGASFLLPAAPTREKLLTLVFVGLASLTVPHMLLEVFAEA